MKNRINNKLLILTLSSAIAMNGCTSKTLDVSKVKIEQVKSSKWNTKGMEKSQKEDCVDCYATISKKTPKRMASAKTIYSYDYSKAANSVELEEYANPYFDNTQITKSKIKLYSNKKSIQVGAFRKYAGAKVYAKRYSLMTSKYNVEIKENVKNNKPIYRVQIEGFSNESEAKNFMSQYSLNGAFLVSR